MKKITDISKKVSSHAKGTLKAVRAKPYNTRKQIIFFLTGFCTIVLVFGWIVLLKNQLTEKNNTSEQTINPIDLIRQDVTRVYNSSTEINTTLSE